MTDVTQPTGALSGIRVLDLTRMLAGPFCTMMLADHGAEVIKIESPEGDSTRNAPFRDSDQRKAIGGYFQSVNRNKRSLCLDLKNPDGRRIFLKLVEEADAVVENFRAGVMERLGLGYETLREVNPRIVYGALRGFGDPRTGTSPYVDWPAYDVVAQAMGGIMSITGPDAATPTKVGPGVGDILPGTMLAFGILAAMHHSRMTGRGQFVDVAMADAVLATCERTIYQHSLNGIVPGPEGNHHPFITPFGMFPAADGFVTIAAQSDAFFAAMCRLLDHDSMLTDERFATRDGRRANRLALIAELGAVTSNFTKAELSERLGGAIPFGPVMTVAEIVNDPHAAAREMVVSVEQIGTDPIQIAGVPVKMTETQGAVRHRARLLGEDTRECLAEAGFSSDDIERFIGNGAALANDRTYASNGVCL